MRLSDEAEPLIDEVRQRRPQIPVDLSELHLPSYNLGWRNALDRLREAIEDQEAAERRAVPHEAD